MNEKGGIFLKIQVCTIDKINFNPCKYSDTLRDSLLRMGQGFPIHVKQKENAYLCIDGHKRLSVISDILKKDPEHSLKNVKILVVNKARTESGTAKNHH